MERVIGRQFDVDAEPVHAEAGTTDEFRTGTGNGLEVDVTAKPVLKSQFFSNQHKPFHGMVWTKGHTGTEEESLDIVAPIKVERKGDDFVGGESGTGNVVAPAIGTVGAVIHAAVGKEEFEQGNAPTVIGPTMANTAGRGVAHAAVRRTPSAAAAGGAGGVIAGGGGKNFEFAVDVHGMRNNRKEKPKTHTYKK